MSKKISLFSLAILMIAAIDNIRNLPAAALFGSELIFFFTFSALVFLIPTALVAAELSSAFPEKGGVYQWVELAFGKKWAMMAIWLQWINTMVWYPSMLSFIAGTFAYLINPELAENKAYLVTCILVVFWSLTYVNLKGLHISALVNNICAIVGTVIPLVTLIILGLLWVLSGHPLQIDFNASSLVPSLSNTTSWVSLIAIMASFLGIELSGVHVNDIAAPQKNFPRAVMLATLFIFVSMSLGSLSIALVLPQGEINLIAGVMQVFTNFFRVFGLEPLIPVLTLLIVVGSVGMMINWLISPAKGLYHAAESGFLPPVFMKKNKAGVAGNILIGQGIVVSSFCLIFLLQPSVNGFYWFLTALSTELYMMMYILMFLAAICLHYKHRARESAFKIPGNGAGIWTVALFGLTGCLSTIVVSFFPPDNVNIGGSFHYIGMIIAGNILTISPIFFLFLYQKRKQALSVQTSTPAI
jgi:amino acid transporter